MILHRFMSDAEYISYTLGKTLHCEKDHGALRGHDVSTAIGFCWFPEDPEKAKHWLLGIVDFDWCLTVDAPEHMIRSCRGRYPNWIKPGVADGVIYRKEFCCTEYDNTRFTLVDVKPFDDYCPGASQLRKYFPQFFTLFP